MDKEIEANLITALKGRSYAYQQDVRKHVAQAMKCPEVDVDVVINFMKDRKEIEPLPQDVTMIRLTHQGIESHSPAKTRTLKYLKTNWVAIVGAVTGIMGTIISIIALCKS